MLLPRRIVLSSSFYLAMGLALLHLAALAGLVAVPLSLQFKLALAAPILASACLSIRRHALLMVASSIRELALKADGTIEAMRNDGGRFDGRVSVQTAVLPWLIVMLIELPDTMRLSPLVILPDSLPDDEWRALRVWLRWKIT